MIPTITSNVIEIRKVMKLNTRVRIDHFLLGSRLINETAARTVATKAKNVVGITQITTPSKAIASKMIAA